MGGLSRTMKAALALAKDGGGFLERLPGGFWVKPGTKFISYGHTDGPNFGSTTVNALISRGVVEVTKRAGKRQFPIEVKVR
jgi:hypothetical protein